jgi:hypothetical protein
MLSCLAERLQRFLRVIPRAESEPMKYTATARPEFSRHRFPVSTTLALAACIALASSLRADQVGGLEASQQRRLDESFATILRQKRGPYTPNFCVCTDGRRLPVKDQEGRNENRCGAASTRFCGAFRNAWAGTLAEEGIYVGNFFAPDLFDWDQFPDHNDLVRGYILEKYFIATHPRHKLARIKAYSGLSNAQHEARDMPLFIERYLTSPDFNDRRHFVLSYELQKRYFVRDNQAEIEKVRQLARRMRGSDPDFKPLSEAVHNQISANQIPKLSTYRDSLPKQHVAERLDADALISRLRELTAVDQDTLASQVVEIENEALREDLDAMLPKEDTDPVPMMAALGKLMVTSRTAASTAKESPVDRRRLVTLDVVAGVLIQKIGTQLLDTGGPDTLGQHLQLLVALADASYGAGLLTAREHQAASAQLAKMLSREETDTESFRQGLRKVERLVDWAHNNVMLAFGDALAAWTYLLPDAIHIGDYILQDSPIRLLARIARRLEEHLAVQNPVHHHLFGKTDTTQVRALNPGLALGTLKVAPQEGDYAPDDILVLPRTPTELKAAAGILSRRDERFVSPIQLLPRSLRIPSAVIAPQAYETIAAHAGTRVFMVVTPGGRLYAKEASAMDAMDRAVHKEFTSSAPRREATRPFAPGAKLPIQEERLDVSKKDPMPLDDIRREDSGVIAGPVAAFLGELRHLFPTHVARGVVLPFGAYYQHYRNTALHVPDDLKGAGIAKDGEPLHEFVARTYEELFGTLVPAGAGEQELEAWLTPRLAVIRHSLRASPLSPELKTAIRGQLDAQGLLLPNDKTQTLGCLMRSDTNVEHQDDFNGSGLNPTLFNLRSMEDIYAGIKEVWASPFTYHAFSRRQAIIDQPLWVLPSVVILESIPNEKEGILVTADMDSGEPTGILIATSEGVGGTVDGTPAETLLCSEDGIELVNQFKSPVRRLIKPGGGTEIVASTGNDHVLGSDEIEALVAAARRIQQQIAPPLDGEGNPRPWEVDFGFSRGKLWLFQVRPFVGNAHIQNLPALAALESRAGNGDGTVSLDERVEPES